MEVLLISFMKLPMEEQFEKRSIFALSNLTSGLLLTMCLMKYNLIRRNTPNLTHLQFLG